MKGRSPENNNRPLRLEYYPRPETVSQRSAIQVRLLSPDEIVRQPEPRRTNTCIECVCACK